MLPSAEKRISGLDMIKALGLYFVVLYHLTFRNSPDLFGGRAMDGLEFFLSTLLSCCVPLLFLVSGALALRRPADLKKSLRRSGQVLLLGLFWAFFSLAAVLAIRGERMSLRDYIYTAWNLKVGYIQHLWYMPVFFFLCLMTPILQALKENAPKVYRYGLLILLLYAFGGHLLEDLEYLLRWILGKGDAAARRDFFWHTNFFGGQYWYAFVYYALGDLLMERRERLRTFRKWSVPAILVSMGALTLFGLAQSHVLGRVCDPVFYNYSNPFTLIITVSAAVLLLDAQPGEKLKECFRSISTCSLGIYLLHWLLVEVLLVHAPALVSGNKLAPLTALAVMGLSWGISWCALKIPGLRRLFTTAGGRRAG